MSDASQADEDRRNWWASRRLTYNLWLVGTGIAVFVLTIAIGGTLCANNDELEITLFTLAFQAFGYLVMMALANVCYFLGPLSEYVLRPRNLENYRRITFFLGTAFSVALPLTVPVHLVLMC